MSATPTIHTGVTPHHRPHIKPRHQVALGLRSSPAEVGRVRREVRGCLEAWQLGGDADAVVLVLSELVSNAVRHAPGPGIDVTVTAADGTVLVEVRDGSGKPPVIGTDSEPYAEGGRGLPLVATLSDTWGWTPHNEHDGDRGKTTWALVPALLPVCGAYRSRPGALDDLYCVLQAHTTGPHQALAHDPSGPGTTAIWATWHNDSRIRLHTRPDCPATSPRNPDDACCAYAHHPGAHTYDLTDPFAVVRP